MDLFKAEDSHPSSSSQIDFNQYNDSLNEMQKSVHLFKVSLTLNSDGQPVSSKVVTGRSSVEHSNIPNVYPSPGLKPNSNIYENSSKVSS